MKSHSCANSICNTAILNHRNRKTCAYRRGSAVVLFGFLIYALSIAMMLLNPEPLNIPVR